MKAEKENSEPLEQLDGKETNGVAMFCFHFAMTFVANAIVCAGAIMLWSTPLGFAKSTYQMLEDNAWYAMPLMALALLILLVLYLFDFFWPQHLNNQVLVLWDGDRFVGRLLLGVAMVLFVLACLLRSQTFQSLPLLISIILCPLSVFGVHLIYDPWKPPEIKDENGENRRRTEIMNSDDVPAKTALLKRITGEETDVHMYYKACVATFFATFVWTLVFWLVFTVGLGTPLAELKAGLDRTGVDKMYIQWTAPLVVSLSNFIFGLLSSLRVLVHQTYSRTNKYKNKILADFMHSALVEEMTSHRVEMLKVARHSQVSSMETGDDLEKKRQQYLEQDVVVAQNLSSIVKGVVCVFIVLIGVGYAAHTMLYNSTHIASMITGTMLVFFVFFMIFSYVSLRCIVAQMGKWMLELPAWKTLCSITTHPFVKAALFCSFIPMLPGILLLSVVNQCMRKCRGLYQGLPQASMEQAQAEASCPPWDTLVLTPRMYNKVVQAKQWEWLVVFNWIYGLCAVYMVWTLCPSLLNVALASLNAWIRQMNLDFSVIVVTVFVVGVLCFLLPPVPGFIVYFFAGLVVSGACPPVDTDQGFWLGATINICMCWVLKLFACAIQQVCIGGMLSKSLWVRQTVGVHTPLMRTIEFVLRKKGLSLGKVAILCGAPDWPVSVLAGILKLSLFECEVGTIPIIGFIIPFALSGSLYLYSGNEDSILGNAAQLMMVCALMVTCVLYAISAWAVQQASEQNGDEFTRPLAKNVDLAWLDFRAEYVSKKLACGWPDVPVSVRVFWVFGAAVQILVCHMFQWQYSSLVGTFEVSDDIEDLNFIAGWKVTDGLFTYASIALIFIYSLAWLMYLVYSCWRRVALGPASREALKECKDMEVQWKEDYIKMAEDRAPKEASEETQATEETKKTIDPEPLEARPSDAAVGISVYV
mmetsp:Transcript_105113/g.307170  ORF Transcript_105113/g.307170 Transcript_105113/m.307170 type:complete len:927 (+) Transcript_105113:164-2944(+)